MLAVVILTHPVSERLATLTMVLAIALLGWTLLRVLWLLLAGPEVEPAPLPPLPRIESDELAASTEWRLFGVPDPQPAYTPVVAGRSPLALRLVGIVTGPSGYAIVIDGEGRERVYRVGDALPGGAEVEAIEARRVVLLRDGRREALMLPESEGGAPDQPLAAAEPAGAGLASGISAASLPSLIAGLGPDPAALAQQILVMPVAGGGFRVRPGRDAVLFQRLGLHANDVVVAVNGRPLHTEADVMALFNEFDPGQRLAITVRRGGREQVLTPEL